MMTQTEKLVLTHHAEAEVYLSASGTFVLTVLDDGTAVRLPRTCYDVLNAPPAAPKTWLRRIGPAFYWAVRFALLIAGWHRHH